MRLRKHNYEKSTTLHPSKALTQGCQGVAHAPAVMTAWTTCFELTRIFSYKLTTHAPGYRMSVGISTPFESASAGGFGFCICPYGLLTAVVRPARKKFVSRWFDLTCYDVFAFICGNYLCA
jgi:hypothetical protein